MSTLPIAKRIVRRVVAPLLSLRSTPQRRTVILHEIQPQEWPMFHAVIARIDSGALGSTTLTFDDGFRSSAEAIRKLRGQKAIFFVCPEYINRAQTNRWQEFFRRNFHRSEQLIDRNFVEAVQPATWDDLRTLVHLGHSIGSHSMNHARLSAVHSRKELEEEIIGSANAIEDKLNVRVEHFAYPFGNIESIDERSYALIERRYMHCYTGIRGNNVRSAHGHTVWRDTVHLHWPMDYIEFILRGGIDWRYVLQRREIERMRRRSLNVVGT